MLYLKFNYQINQITLPNLGNLARELMSRGSIRLLYLVCSLHVTQRYRCGTPHGYRFVTCACGGLGRSFCGPLLGASLGADCQTRGRLSPVIAGQTQRWPRWRYDNANHRGNNFTRTPRAPKSNPESLKLGRNHKKMSSASWTAGTHLETPKGVPSACQLFKGVPSAYQLFRSRRQTPTGFHHYHRVAPRVSNGYLRVQ